jgi:hypothetical protein
MDSDFGAAIVLELAKLNKNLSDIMRAISPRSGDQANSLRVAAVARELEVSEKKVRGWIKTGKLTAIDLNPAGSIRTSYSINRADLEIFKKTLTPKPVVRRSRRKDKASFQRY